MIQSQSCVGCGSELTGKYCSQCGEKRPSPHDYSILHFFENAFEAFTHFDFKALRAFKTLILKPGTLTRDYLAGKRKAYVGPLQLFLVANILFALFGSSSFRTPLAVQLTNPPFAAMKQAKVAEEMAHRTITDEAFHREFDSTASLQAKTWIFLMIPMFALTVAVLYGFRRYFFEHIIFATHFFAFTLLWMTFVRLGIVWTVWATGVHLTDENFDTLASLTVLIGLGVYLFPALRQTYGGGIILSSARTLAVLVLFFPILLVYRFVLFFVTLKAMH